MKLSKLLAEGLRSQFKIIDSPEENSVFKQNGKAYYIKNISGNNVTAHTYTISKINFTDYKGQIIVLDDKKHKFSLSNLDMKSALNLIDFQRVSGVKVLTEKEWKKFKRSESARNKKMSTRQYEKILKGAMEDMRSDGYENFTFDVAQNLALDPDIRRYAEEEYGRNWMQNLQWDLESFI